MNVLIPSVITARHFEQKSKHQQRQSSYFSIDIIEARQSHPVSPKNFRKNALRTGWSCWVKGINVVVIYISINRWCICLKFLRVYFGDPEYA